MAESSPSQEEVEGSRSFLSSLGLALMVLICCGLPILLLSAGSLTFLAFITSRVTLIVTGIAIILLLLVIRVVVGRKNNHRQVRPS